MECREGECGGERDWGMHLFCIKKIRSNGWTGDGPIVDTQRKQLDLEPHSRLKSNAETED